MHYLHYDDEGMRVSGADRAALPLKAALKALEIERTSETQGWMDLRAGGAAAFAMKMVAEFKQRGFRRLLVVGIGGSDLGARALVQALEKKDKGMEVEFLSAPDPEAFARLVPSREAWRRTALSVVSKSGGTLETLAVCLALRASLMRAVGRTNAKKHVYVTTDIKEGNPLLEFARAEGYEILPHPLNVGGRYSALSIVGLLPAACAGANVRGLLLGARWMEEQREKLGATSPAARFAANQVLALRRGHPIHVLMPYADGLADVARWYRQLWAESLGKDGQGPTPIAAVGPVDQHSQMQLYLAGPNDKTITFIAPESVARVLIPKVAGPKKINQLGGLTFGDLLRAERLGTAEALQKAGRPTGTFFLPSISAESVGALLQCLMQATAIAGSLLNVNAFDQPGVEAGKQAARRLLSLD